MQWARFFDFRTTAACQISRFPILWQKNTNEVEKYELLPLPFESTESINISLLNFIEWYWTDLRTIVRHKISQFPIMWPRNEVEDEKCKAYNLKHFPMKLTLWTRRATSVVQNVWQIWPRIIHKQWPKLRFCLPVLLHITFDHRVARFAHTVRT